MAWTDPRTWVAGSVVTAAQLNAHVRDNLDALRRRIAFGTITSSVTVDATSEAAADFVVSSGTVTFDDSPKRITLASPRVQVATSTTLNLPVLRGGTVIGKVEFSNGNAAQHSRPETFSIIDPTPPAGTYAYSVEAWRTVGSSCIIFAGTAGSDNYFPTSLVVGSFEATP